MFSAIILVKFFGKHCFGKNVFGNKNFWQANCLEKNVFDESNLNYFILVCQEQMRKWFLEGHHWWTSELSILRYFNKHFFKLTSRTLKIQTRATDPQIRCTSKIMRITELELKHLRQFNFDKRRNLHLRPLTFQPRIWNGTKFWSELPDWKLSLA